MNYQARSSQEGFSLIEIMVVMTIIGILSGLAYVSYSTVTNMAARSSTTTNLKTIKNAIGLYKMQVGALPGRLEDLVERPKTEESGKKWPGALIEGGLPTDGWNNSFYYKVTQGRKNPYELYSYGPNGPEEGTPEERIDAWEI